MRISRCLAAALGLAAALPVRSAEVLYSSSNRFEGPYPGGYSNPPGYKWYPTATCSTNGSWWQQQAVLTGPEEACRQMAQKRLEEVRVAQPPNVTKCLTYTTSMSSIACGQKYVCKPGQYPGQQVCGYEPIIYPICNITVTRDARPSTKLVPAYIVVNLNYSVHGNDSSISYTNEAGRGSTFEVSYGTSGKLNIGADPNSSLASEYTFTETSSTKLATQTTSSNSSHVISDVDPADYLSDRIVFWLNPVITTYTGCGLPDTSVYSAAAEGRAYMRPGDDPSKPLTESFTIHELLDPSLIPDTDTDRWRRIFVEQFTRQEMLDLASGLDPRITPDGKMNMAPYLDPNRYRAPSGDGGACKVTFEGVKMGAPLECTVKYSYALEDTTKFDVNWQVSLRTKLLGGASGTLGTHYGRTYTETNTTSNSAVIHIGTSTPYTCLGGQLYIDTMFNTYVVNGVATYCAY